MSNKTKFTPGPWKAVETDLQADDWNVVDGKGHAVMLGGVMKDEEENLSNCHLTAAAPALYRALEETFDWMKGMGFQHESATNVAENIIKALALARGETTDK